MCAPGPWNHSHCTPAFPGQEGFVGATMGEHSTVRGAGRVMSRTKAAGKQRKRWMHASVILRGTDDPAGRDPAPSG